MRATRAYIASAGTAAVMLGASLAMLALVSGFVAFGSWPGSNAASKVDQVFLNIAAKPSAKPVSVRSDAVVIARRAEARRQLALARAQTQAGQPGAGTLPAGTPVAIAPTTTGAPTTGGSPAASPTGAVTRPTQTVRQNLDTTTNNVTTQVGKQVQNVQTQVNQVVDQVIGGPQAPQDGNTVDNTVQTVNDTAGSVLGH